MNAEDERDYAEDAALDGCADGRTGRSRAGAALAALLQDEAAALRGERAAFDAEREIDTPEALRKFIQTAIAFSEDAADVELDVRSFADAGVITLDQGLVIESFTADGTRHVFQVTIVRSR